MLQDETFIQAILENPKEEANWLVYADWLEERGDPRTELYRHRRLTDSLGMEFALVPRGSFWMGGGGGKPGEKQVTIEHEFYLGVYPVTQGQWAAIMGSNPSYFSRAGSAAKGPSPQRTTKVGSYQPNRLGIHDIHGSVWEWTDSVEGSGRVLRGGCWCIYGSDCRAAFRRRLVPSNRDYALGFRLTLSASGGSMAAGV
jgi:uncharacterized protein (TIGR02996 family)